MSYCLISLTWCCSLPKALYSYSEYITHIMVICLHAYSQPSRDCSKGLSYAILCSNRWQTFRWSVGIELIRTLKLKSTISLFRMQICIHLNLTQTIGLSLAGKMKISSMNIDVIWVLGSQRLSIIYIGKEQKHSLDGYFKCFTCFNWFIPYHIIVK